MTSRTEKHEIIFLSVALIDEQPITILRLSKREIMTRLSYGGGTMSSVLNERNIIRLAGLPSNFYVYANFLHSDNLHWSYHCTVIHIAIICP